jgi:ABC-2 type transport system permease protein
VSRSVIVLGKVLGGTTLATLQGLVFVLFTPALKGGHLGADNILPIVYTLFMISFALTALGFAIAWPMDSPQAFHGIINLFFLPLWLISGALFPLSGASGWIRVLMRVNPLTYGNEALRALLFPGTQAVLPIPQSLAVLTAFAVAMFLLSWLVANRRTTKPAA